MNKMKKYEFAYEENNLTKNKDMNQVKELIYFFFI